MKEVFESVIRQGGYDLPDMLHKIDLYHVAGKLTDQEREELYTLARAGADPSVGLDLAGKVVELEAKMLALAARVDKLEGGGQEPEPEEPPEYVPGKWYYNGDRVQFGGKVYICTAPEGTVCTWNPEEYPAFWEEAKE